MNPEFTEITNVISEEFGEVISFIVNSIPDSERPSLEVIKERVAGKKERIFVGRVDDKIVLAALIWPLEGTKFVLLDYLRVREGNRNRGFGSAFMKNIFQISQMKNRTFIIEVDDPLHGDDKEVRKRRVAFYRRCGAKEMKGIKYILSPFQGNSPTQMIIMLISQQKKTCLPGNLVRRLFVQIYKELYSRNEDDPLLKSFKALVPLKVEIV